MTMGWHMVMDSSDASAASSGTRTIRHEMIRKSQECVINVPTYDIVAQGDRDREFHRRRHRQVRGVQADAGEGGKVKAPLIRECYANFECKLVDTSLIQQIQPVCVRGGEGACRDLAALSRTIHYRGDGRFMVSGKEVDYARYFKPEML